MNMYRRRKLTICQKKQQQQQQAMLLQNQQQNQLQQYVPQQFACQDAGSMQRQQSFNNQLIQLQQQALQQPRIQAQQLPQPQQPMLVDVEPSIANQQQASNELIGYYFGSISRETAEWILKTHGNQKNGAYLLRSSGPNDDFVLSLMVCYQNVNKETALQNANNVSISATKEVLHYKIVETEDSFVALHGQVGDEKFATIDELIEKAQGVATKPCWPVYRQALESQILPPTYWGLTVDQVRLAILIKAKQWGFPLFSTLFQQPTIQHEKAAFANGVPISNGAIQPDRPHQVDSNGSALAAANATTLNNETIRTLIYKSLHEFQPWFHGRISREEAERRIEEGSLRDGRFLVRERDNFSYAMCISHKKTTKHYRIDVLPTGELAIQDGRKFTSLMALISHYTIMSDGLWCALTEACPRPIQSSAQTNDFDANQNFLTMRMSNANTSGLVKMNQNNLYCIPPSMDRISGSSQNMMLPSSIQQPPRLIPEGGALRNALHRSSELGPNQGAVTSIKAPIKEWLHNINHKWTQLMASKNQHQSLNSFLFGSSNPLNNHCRHSHRNHQNHLRERRKSKNGHTSCSSCSHHHATRTECRGPALAISGNHVRLANQSNNITRHQDGALKRNNCNCSQANPPPLATTGAFAQVIPTVKHGNLILPYNNGVNQFGINHPLANTNVLLSNLPQNSGFALNSQSFVGSPLFAVEVPQGDNLNSAGELNNNNVNGSNSSSGDGGHSAEEKLISPAHSVSANLNNNPYNSNMNDIYGSQTSTAIVNDQMPTSSSSSSGNPHSRIVAMPSLSSQHVATLKQRHQIAQQFDAKKNLNGNLFANNNQYHQSVVPNSPPPPVHQKHKQMTPPIKSAQQAGQILCGHHAGPAYRYTNCTGDENSFGSCIHSRPIVSCRAADDSQLMMSSTQLATSAALAKFVQFQDGQCLRTHRDTRSIQMAYLSSARSAPRGANFARSHENNQVPLSQIQNVAKDQFGYSLRTNSIEVDRMKSKSNFNEHNDVNFQAGPTSQKQSCGDIDLMDCDGVGFDFKYDPKLIKSSSIETLCGAGDENENREYLAEYKTNSELVMSLQPSWCNKQVGDILNPIPSSMCQESFIDQSEQGQNDNFQQSMLASYVEAATREENEHFDNMRKKHDLDELTTALLAELTASLKAQVDLKNKRSGLGTLHNMDKQNDQTSQNTGKIQHFRNEQTGTGNHLEANPSELVNEFDTLISRR